LTAFSRYIGSEGRAHQIAFTCRYFRILSSLVTTAATMLKAVAMIMRSAGSLWKDPGKLTLLSAMALPTGTKVTRRTTSHLAIQSDTSMVRRSRSLATRRAISQVLIEEISIAPLAPLDRHT
jgi:hypothetical protein